MSPKFPDYTELAVQEGFPPGSAGSCVAGSLMRDGVRWRTGQDRDLDRADLLSPITLFYLFEIFKCYYS